MMKSAGAGGCVLIDGEHKQPVKQKHLTASSACGNITPVMDRFVRNGLLLGYYGGCLTKTQQAMMQLYYEQDYSLGEIAQSHGMSRQAVADALRRAEQSLERLEKQVGMAETAHKTKALAHNALELLDSDPRKAAENLHEIINLWE